MAEKLKLIECKRGYAETVLGGQTYIFSADKYGRFTCDVTSFTHRALLLSVAHYREVERELPQMDLSALEYTDPADFLDESEDDDTDSQVDGADPAAELAAELAADPAAEPAAELAADPAADPAAELAAELAADPAADPAAEPAAEPAAKNGKKAK